MILTSVLGNRGDLVVYMKVSGIQVGDTPANVFNVDRYGVDYILGILSSYDMVGADIK